MLKNSSKINKSMFSKQKQIIFIFIVLLIFVLLGLFCYLEFIKISVKNFNTKKTQNIVVEKKIEKKLIINNNLPQSKEEKSINFLFFGDLMLDRHVGEKISKNGLDYIFTKLVGEENRFFKGIDIISANLEGAVTDGGAHYKPDMSYDFAFDPKLINDLKKYNFNFFNIANNHLADQGERGIIETRNNLEKMGFSFVGCRDLQVSNCSSTTLEIAEKKIGMIAFSQIYGLLDEKEVIKTITSLKNKIDLVVVNIHWGTEYQHKFNTTQQDLAHKMIDAGADMIIGHHPHVVQGMEIYKNKPIFYSLGNFVFDQYFSQDTQEELALGINYSTKDITVNLFPMKSKMSQVELMNEKEKEIFIKKFIEWSKVDEMTAKQILAGKIIITD
jgi:gamma-polyglutamate biosynthesis protein CapA